MQCETYREAISARLDGEPLGMPAAELDAHLSACAACAAWSEAAAQVTRRIRPVPAPTADLTAAVLAAVRPDPVRRGRRRPPAGARREPASGGGRGVLLLRVVLGAVGVAQAVLAWPEIAFGGGSMPAPVHMTHETGAWNLGVAAAFLAVAAAPRLAAGALTFLGSFCALLVALTADDLIAGRVPAQRALDHLLLVAGAALVAAIAWRRRRRGTAPAVARDRIAA
jgi:predicted anti-sigma-YlaC factor YlaD